MKRRELQIELEKGKELVKRMASATAEMSQRVKEAEAKLRVMEAWVCVILQETCKEINLEKDKISDALVKYRLHADLSEDGKAIFLSVQEVSSTTALTGDTGGTASN